MEAALTFEASHLRRYTPMYRFHRNGTLSRQHVTGKAEFAHE
jgi:hypothetical protein